MISHLRRHTFDIYDPSYYLLQGGFWVDEVPGRKCMVRELLQY